MLKDLCSKFKKPWLQNFLMFEKDAGVNLLEYVHGENKLKLESWETFKKSMGLNFVRFILPTFTELDDLSPHDLGQIMNSHNSSIAHFFRSCNGVTSWYFRRRLLQK